MIKKLLSLVGVIVLALGLIWFGRHFDHWLKHHSDPKWMSDIAKKYDAQYAGTQAGYVVVSLACYDPYQSQKSAMGLAPITYAYVKMDVNFQTGEMRPVEEPQLPPVETWTCSQVMSTKPPVPPTLQPVTPQTVGPNAATPSTAPNPAVAPAQPQSQPKKP